MLILAELRKQRRISQKVLADALGCSQNMISQWENGTRDPGTETLKAIADYFQVTIDCLLGRDGTAAPTNKDEAIAKLMEIYNQLTPEQQQELEAYAKFKASQNQK